jgi:glycine cleavage system H protein
VSDLFAPLTGEVLESNAALGSEPELVNREPFKGGWMIRLKVADPKQLEDLLEPAAYDALVAEG